MPGHVAPGVRVVHRPPMSTSFYRKELPTPLVAFGSSEGRTLLVEALAQGTAESFHALVAHLHTQAEPAWCGLGTLVTALNALEIDPGRVWKGPWRFFGEELLVCCKALDVAAAEGLTLAEVGCLAECNGAAVERHHADDDGEAAFRASLMASVKAQAGPFVIANYDRATLGQSGTGHFSPLAAVHVASDRVLVLDVARFKYPPHWVDIATLWRAMTSVDGDSGKPRGYLVLARPSGPARVPDGLEELVSHLRRVGASMCPSPPRT